MRRDHPKSSLRGAPTTPDGAIALVSSHPTMTALRAAAAACTACPLYARAMQTVFGEGPEHAPLVLVGETPGDQEDRQGRPFVGPAGHLLDRCLVVAGIDRDKAYVTNVVKHFKWTPRGRRRLHGKPSAARSAGMQTLARCRACADRTQTAEVPRPLPKCRPPAGDRRHDRLSLAAHRRPPQPPHNARNPLSPTSSPAASSSASHSTESITRRRSTPPKPSSLLPPTSWNSAMPKLSPDSPARRRGPRASDVRPAPGPPLSRWRRLGMFHLSGSL
jgi:uracil-DNA glycosylase